MPAASGCQLDTGGYEYYYYCPAFGGSTGTSAEAARRKAAEAAQKKLAAETLAKQKALEEELAKKGSAAIENQKSALSAADDISLTGMNQAANIGAVWCAHGANAHLNDKDLAEQSFGTCKDYMGAADALRSQRGRNETFTVDNDTISGEWASGILGDFEKNFGVAAGDFMSRLLGSGDRSGDLSDMTKGKIGEGELAEAHANGKGKGEFELAVGGKGGAAKKSRVRDDLKKALAAEAKRKLASEKKDAIAAAVDKRKDKDSIEGLKAMGSAEAFGLSDTEELTIFQVVHRKYEEIFRERRKL